MAVDLTAYVPSLLREVQPPGTSLYAGVGEADWVQYLADGFWEARLDGFLEGFVVAQGGFGSYELLPPTGMADSAPEVRMAISLMVMYAGIRVLRNRILNTNTSFRAKAGPVEFEQQNSATMLAEMLKQLRMTKDRILEQLDAGMTPTLVLDAYSQRVFSPLSYGGGAELTG